ncbi:MAG TPA: hypothetical protein VFV52_08815, partial [Bacilli bacterium]|nr:hypothetical protein [Bacilli bacterium]
ASAVNLGNSLQVDFKNNKKHNQGFGTVDGDHNKVDGLRSVLHDPDVIDMLNLDNSEIPDWMRDLLAGAMRKMAEEREEESCGEETSEKKSCRDDRDAPLGSEEAEAEDEADLAEDTRHEVPPVVPEELAHHEWGSDETDWLLQDSDWVIETNAGRERGGAPDETE